MQSKRRVIVGWRQVPVQKVRARAGRTVAVPAVVPAPPAAADIDDDSGEASTPDVPGRAK